MPNPLRVLLVEDNRNDAALVQHELKRADFDVTAREVSTQASYLQALDREDWDVILCDFTLPRFGGLQALNLLKQKNLDIPFIFVSGTMGEDVAVAGMRAGAQDYFVKGHLRRLGAAIQRELRERAVRKERQEAEAAKLAMESRYRLLFENAPEGILIADVETKTIHGANPMICRMLGYTEVELWDRDIRDLHPSGDVSRVMENFESISRGQSRMASDIPCLRKDGSVFFANISGSTALLEGRRCAVGFFSDITNGKRQEKERQRLQDQLVQSQKMESIGGLAGGVAHDFNNLLAVVLWHSAALSRGEVPADQVSRSLEAIHIAATRGAGVVRQLLTFAKKSERVHEIFDLGTLLLEGASLVRGTFPKNIKVRTHCEPSLPPMEGDPTQIHQVLLNLCVNARDAMPSGGRLTLSLRLVPRSEVPAGQWALLDQPYLEIRVSDEGYGMDEELLKHIFEPFFTTKGPEKGTGLGLAVVYGIVDSHHGAIDVRSEPGRGTTFFLYFPTVAGRTSAAPVRVPNGVGNPGKGETIFLIEDEPMLRELFCILLISQGYKVRQARDGIEALEIFSRESERIDLVITDLRLPDISGDEVVRRIRHIAPEAKMVVSTGYLEPEVAETLDLIGVEAVIQKPFSPEDFLRKIREVLDRS